MKDFQGLRLFTWGRMKMRCDQPSPKTNPVSIYEQLRNCSGARLRGCEDITLEHKKKLRSARLETVASIHRLPRVKLRRRNLSGENMDMLRVKEDLLLLSQSTNLFKSLSSPDISMTSEWEDDSTKSKTDIGSDLDKKKEDFASLGERDKEVELLETLPRKLVIKKTMKILGFVT